jgi:hypothetical protein
MEAETEAVDMEAVTETVASTEEKNKDKTQKSRVQIPLDAPFPSKLIHLSFSSTRAGANRHSLPFHHCLFPLRSPSSL